MVKRLGCPHKNAPAPEVLLTDVSPLLYHVVWPVFGNASDVAHIMKVRRESDKYGTAEKFLIFDRYNEVSAKDQECHSRADEGAMEFNLSLTSSPPSRESIMKNKKKKREAAESAPLHL